MTPQEAAQFAQNCDRWVADTQLMNLLKTTEQKALLEMGMNTDVNMMLRAQGAYKGISEFIDMIQKFAARAETLRLAARAPSPFDFPPR